MLGYYWKKFELNCITNLEMPEGGHYVPPPVFSGTKKPGLNRVNTMHPVGLKTVEDYSRKYV